MKQINTLLYCLGEEAEAVLSSTGATEDDRKVVYYGGTGALASIQICSLPNLFTSKSPSGHVYRLISMARSCIRT